MFIKIFIVRFYSLKIESKSNYLELNTGIKYFINIFFNNNSLNLEFLMKFKKCDIY